MRRFLCGSVFILFSWCAVGQAKIGIQLNPTFSSNRVESQSNLVNVSNDNASLKFKFGPVVDIPISETYYFFTGVLYAPKQAAIIISDSNTGIAISELYNLQYLQIPLAMKLYTNEIALDTRLYFALGVLAEFKIHEEADKKQYISINKFRIIDTSLMLSAGVEYNIGLNTALFGGLTYNRGLINAITEHLPLDEDIMMKNDLISIDLGVKF